jgi:hypothetical protein
MCHRAQMRRSNFAELRQCEVRGKPFPRTRVNRPSAALPRPEALTPSEAKAQPSPSLLALSRCGLGAMILGKSERNNLWPLATIPRHEQSERGAY